MSENNLTKYGSVKSVNMFLDNQNNQRSGNFFKLEFICKNGSFSIIAYGDCCSISYFDIDENDDKKIIGKTIKNIKKSFSKVDDSYSYDCKKVSKIDLIFLDLTMFSFNLINLSNGYYDGWFEIEE